MDVSTKHRRSTARRAGTAALLMAVAATAVGTATTAAGVAARVNSPAAALPPGITQEVLDAALEEGEVNLYTAQGESSEVVMAAAFNESFPDISVNILRMGSAPLFEKINVERDAGQDIFDVVTFADEAIMVQARDAGLLANRRELGLEPDPENFIAIAFNDDDGFYVNILVTVAAMAYNSETMPEGQAPDSWDDLLSPDFAGAIGGPENDGGGPGWAIQYFLRRQFGEDVWQRLDDQDPVWFDSSAAAIQAVENGEQLVTFAADSSIYPFVQNGLVQLVIPSDVIMPMPYAQAISARAPHPNAAAVFAAWYTSTEGATALSEETGAWSTRTDVPAPEGRAPIDSVEASFFTDRDDLFDPEFVQTWYAEWQEIMGTG